MLGEHIKQGTTAMEVLIKPLGTAKRDQSHPVASEWQNWAHLKLIEKEGCSHLVLSLAFISSSNLLLQLLSAFPELQNNFLVMWHCAYRYRGTSWYLICCNISKGSSFGSISLSLSLVCVWECLIEGRPLGKVSPDSSKHMGRQQSVFSGFCHLCTTLWQEEDETENVTVNN